MKKHQNKIKYIIVVIVFVCILIAYTARTINKEGDLNFFEKAIKDSVNFSAKIFYSPIKFVKDKVEIFNETKDLYEKYTALKEQEEKNELLIETDRLKILKKILKVNL